MVLNNLLNPVLSPLLMLGPTWAVIVISLLIALLITFSYKWMTDQEMMKRLKGEVKEMNQQMKKLKDQPEKMMAVQKEMMAKKYDCDPTTYPNWLRQRIYYVDTNNTNNIWDLDENAMDYLWKNYYTLPTQEKD